MPARRNSKSPTGAFGILLNQYITCNANGTSAPTFSGFTWSDFENIYNNLDGTKTTSGSSQYILKNASANENGTAIEQFVARYDYIVGKYHYTDFLGRNPASIGSGRINTINENVFNDNTFIIVIVAIGTITMVGGFVFMRKKKER